MFVSGQNVPEACVPISECPLLNWMMRNKHQIPGKTAAEVIDHVASKSCGFEDSIPLVNCPLEEDADEVGNRNDENVENENNTEENEVD